jgi:hypothetical protein
MAKSTAILREARTVAAERRRLTVSGYDRVSSTLIALLISLGAITSIVVTIWISTIVRKETVAIPFEMVEVGDGEGGGDGRPMGGSQLDAPSDEYVVGNDKLTADSPQQSLSAMGVEAAAKELDMDEPDPIVPQRRGSLGTGGGMGGGFGDGRGLGHGPGRGGRPRNWEIYFQKGSTLDLYARQLDYFGIEIGIVKPGGKIDYAFHLSNPKPDTRSITDAYKNEQRYWLRWTQGDLQQADRELAMRAGLDPEAGWLFKFMPRETEVKLYTLERLRAGEERWKNVKRTQFGVKTVGSGFEFYVIDQNYK